MTQRALSGIWTDVPLEHRRRLIALLSQIAARQITRPATTEGEPYADSTTEIPWPEQQDAGPASGPLGGRLRPTIDAPAARTSSRVHASAIRARRSRPGLRLGPAAGAGDG